MIYKGVILVCIVLFSTQNAFSLPDASPRVNHDEAATVLALIKTNILETADQTTILLTQQEANTSTAIDSLLVPSIARLNDITKQYIKAIEEMQTELESGGNHHVISLCISYDLISQVRKSTTALLNTQVSTPKHHMKRAADLTRTQINTLKASADTIVATVDTCNENPDPDTCFNGVVTNANAAGDENIYGILKAYSDGITFAQNLYQLTGVSLNSYIDSAMKTQQDKVASIKSCIDTEVK